MHDGTPYSFGRPSRAQSQSKRDAVLRVAREIFETKGFDAATVSEIASAAGVSSRTMYKWHPDKPSLFSAAFAESPEEACRLLLREKNPPKRRVVTPTLATDGVGAAATCPDVFVNPTALRLPSLAQLSSLDSLYRLGSLRAAAEEQKTTVTALSQRIRSLEEDLDRTLLQRSSGDKRKANFTTDGMALATFVHDWLAMLYDHIGSRPRAGRLKRRR